MGDMPRAFSLADGPGSSLGMAGRDLLIQLANLP